MKLERDLYKEVIAEFSRKEIGIIIGPRQVGKTTLLKKIAAYCNDRKLKSQYFNLELPQDAEYFGGDSKQILADLTGIKQAVFIDEFHYLPNATKLFKAIYDGDSKVKVFASGSSALEMHRHLKESLAGRRRLYRLYPLSFAEWLPSKTHIELPLDLKQDISAKIHGQLTKYLKEFILYGGMPALVHENNEDDKKKLLLDLVATYIQKDIKALIKEEDILSFNRLLSLLAAQEGGLLSENSVSQTLNYSLRQVRKDIAILSQMFLLTVLKPFFTNRGRELKQTNKIYFFDSGIRNAILRDFRMLDKREDKGQLTESFVLQEMQKHLCVAQEIYYWRTREKYEVDFVLVKDRQPVPIEVKSKISDKEIPQGIKQFFRAYPESKTAVVLNQNIHDTVIFEDKLVIYAPHYMAHLIPAIQK